FLTGLPVLPKPHVHNDHIGTAELSTELFLGHFRDRALNHRRLEQQAYEGKTHRDGEHCVSLPYRHTVSPLCSECFPVEVASSHVDAAARHRCQQRRQLSHARLSTLALAPVKPINTTRGVASWSIHTRPSTPRPRATRHSSDTAAGAL